MEKIDHGDAHPDLLALADSIDSLTRGQEEWVVQDPKGESFCFSMTSRDVSDPEREVREWFAKHRQDFPESRFAGYEVVKKTSLSPLERLAKQAADQLRLQASPRKTDIQADPRGLLALDADARRDHASAQLMAWEPLQEDIDERQRFDRDRPLYRGDVRLQIATCLELWATGKDGSGFAAHCRIMANEVARLYATAPQEQSATKTLRAIGYTYLGGEMWKPPLGKPPQWIADALSEENTPVLVNPAEEVKPADLEAAYELGAKGGKPSEVERLLFEAWMRGHSYEVVGKWNGTTYKHPDELAGRANDGAMGVRVLWGAWRDRAALGAQQAAQQPATCSPAEVHAGLPPVPVQVMDAITAYGDARVGSGDSAASLSTLIQGIRLAMSNAAAVSQQEKLHEIRRKLDRAHNEIVDELFVAARDSLIGASNNLSELLGGDREVASNNSGRAIRERS